MEDNQKEVFSYGVKAMHWHEARIRSCQEAMVRSWKVLVLALSLLFVMLLVLLYVLFHDKTSIVVIHHRADGSAWLSELNTSLPSISKEETEGNLVHYLRARESYYPSSYKYQYLYVKSASSPLIYHHYERKESYHDKNSVLSQDGGMFSRQVLIHDVMFMPTIHQVKKSVSQQDPMADIAYQVCRRSLIDGSSICREKHALIAWHYRGMPSDPKQRWMNWRGFTVTYFEVIAVSDSHSVFDGRTRRK